MNQPIQTTAIATRVGERMRALAVPDDTAQIYGIAEKMAAAGLIPASLKTIDAAFLAMMKGAEYGLLPQQALAGFYVIGNVAHPYGTCLAGIVKAAPSFEDETLGCIEGVSEMRYMSTEENPYAQGTVRHGMFAELQRSLKRRLARVEDKVGKDTKLAMYWCGWSVMKRRDCEPVCMLFDSYDAQKGQLLTKDMWGKWPTRMHMHRAATFNRRDTFADSLMGLDVTAEEAMEFAPIDLGTQPAPAPRAESTGPGATLADLAKPRADATAARVVQVEVVQPAQAPAAAPPAATGKDRDAIYATTGQSPATDIPLVGEEAPNSEAAPDEAPKAAPKGKTGAAALAAAVKAAKDAGLDAAAIGSAATAAMFGEGVATKDLGDGDKAKLAQAIMGKIEAETAQQGTETEDDAEF